MLRDLLGWKKPLSILGGFLIFWCVVAELAAAELKDGKISVDGREQRAFSFYVPPGRGQVPLVMLFHGSFQSAERVASYTQMHELAEEEGFAVVYPEALNLARAWQSDVSENMRFVEELIDYLVDAYGIDRQRVYATGMSSGGVFSIDLACDRPDIFAALAPVVASFPTGGTLRCQPGRSVPIVFFHGTEDFLIPFDGGVGFGALFESAPETVEFWAENNGCGFAPDVRMLPNLDTRDGTTVEELDYGCGVMHYVANDAGHTWPGADRSAGWLGNTTRDISANEKMWAFFNDL